MGGIPQDLERTYRVESEFESLTFRSIGLMAIFNLIVLIKIVLERIPF